LRYTTTKGPSLILIMSSFSRGTVFLQCGRQVLQGAQEAGRRRRRRRQHAGRRRCRRLHQSLKKIRYDPIVQLFVHKIARVDVPLLIGALVENTAIENLAVLYSRIDPSGSVHIRTACSLERKLCFRQKNPRQSIDWSIGPKHSYCHSR
jgi:hypothetical protein